MKSIYYFLKFWIDMDERAERQEGFVSRSRGGHYERHAPLAAGRGRRITVWPCDSVAQVH